MFPDTDFSLREEGASGGGGPAGELLAARGQRAGDAGASLLCGAKQGSGIPRPQPLTALPSLFSDI